MRIQIYGGGAVGLGLASCLIKSRAYVDIVARQDTVSALRKEGLRRVGIFGDHHARPHEFGSYSSLSQISNGQYDHILVCTKSPDSLVAAKDISQHASLFNGRTKIVLCQNGWGNAATFSSFFDERRIFNARIITGFTRNSPNQVEVTVHADPIHLGSLFGSDVSCIQDLCDRVSVGGIPCESTTEIGKDLWAKMLYNCALNPLGAILNVPYGDLASHLSTRTLMAAIVKEVFSVMSAAGYTTHWKCPDDFLRVFYEKLVPMTASHRSSTLQDILANKATEIEALNGAIVRLAQQQRLNVPFNVAVYSIVKFLEPGARDTQSGDTSSAAQVLARVNLLSSNVHM